MARSIIFAIVCACLLAACGQSSQPRPALTTSSSTAAPSSQPRPALTTSSSTAAPSFTGSAFSVSPGATSAPAAAAGCGTYCQQAGVSQGDPWPGYPCPKAGCLPCPPHNCVTLQSTGATATNGVATVRLSCNLSTACRGAFLICLPLAACASTQTIPALGGRLAGSDFVVPSGSTSEIGVALTTIGKQVVSGPGAFRAAVLVDLLDYGGVLYSGSPAGNSNLTLTSTDPPSFPAGTTAGCGSAVFVGPHTSCLFARNVVKAYLFSYGSAVRAFSPVTGHTYVMHCTDSSPYVCRGGTNALVEFYS